MDTNSTDTKPIIVAAEETKNKVVESFKDLMLDQSIAKIIIAFILPVFLS